MLTIILPSGVVMAVILLPRGVVMRSHLHLPRWSGDEHVITTLPSGVVMNSQGRSQKSQIDDNRIEIQIGILIEIL